MNIFRWGQDTFINDHNILCAALPNPETERDAIYPTFCKIPPKGKSASHNHYESECFFIIKGKGLMIINNEESEVQSGDLVRIPSFTQHELKNSGDEELNFLSIYSEDFCIPKLPTSAILTVAPPTPNGPLHLGHISGPYLGSDVLARYLRLRSTAVLSHSGTDDHQNYVGVQADIVKEETIFFRKKMRSRIQSGLEAFEIKFNEFIQPAEDREYQKQVLEFAENAINANVIQLEDVAFPHCDHCHHFLLDALIKGQCPRCEEASQGCCENCGLVAPPYELNNIQCTRCHQEAGKRNIQVYTFNLGQFLPGIQEDLQKLKLSPRLQKFVQTTSALKNLKVLVSHPDKNSQSLCLPGSNQALHVWFEMAAHYEKYALSKETWVHSFGFDNSFYYLLFIPALHRAINPKAKLPDAVITNEFLQLDGLKFSTSRNHAIWADEFIGNFDHLRFYLCLHRPSISMTNFSQNDFNKFSDELNLKMTSLKNRAKVLAIDSDHKIDPDCLVLCNRVTRDLELFFSPTHFDLRRACHRLIELVDINTQWAGSARNEKLLLQVLGTLLAPIMPKESKQLLDNLNVATGVWITDWTRSL